MMTDWKRTIRDLALSDRVGIVRAVPSFRPLLKPMPLPTVGDTIERPVMDMKVKPRAFAFERARDVAAFANHLGGTLLIGARETDQQLRAYVGMSEAEAGAVLDDYSKAVAARCQPRPALDFEQYEHPGDSTKRIVTINVQPSLNLVGVKLAGDKATDGYGGPAYVFPVRSGTDATYLEPGQLAMFMTPQTRRAAVLLARIPLKSRVHVNLGSGRPNQTWLFDGVVEEDNIVRFRTEETSKLYHLPLDRVLTVYQDPVEWRVVMAFHA